MSKYTEHLKLVKPEGNEYYNVEQFNHNAELIDKETKKLSEDLAKVQEGATREKSGIVQFGTEEGKALEGMMLARLSGCIGYGGDIQDDIIKNPNYIYYDRNTRKMYKCLKQNQDISANVANFIPLDNNSLLERLENLSTFKVQELFSSPSGVKFTVFQCGNLILVTAYTYVVEFLAYGVQYRCTLPFNCYDNSTAITGNYGTCGHFTLRDNVLIVNSTDSKNPLKNSFMGQLITFLK